MKLLENSDELPQDPTTQSLFNIRIALRMIAVERQSLYNNGLLLSFTPSMSGGLSVSLTPK